MGGLGGCLAAAARGRPPVAQKNLEKVLICGGKKGKFRVVGPFRSLAWFWSLLAFGVWVLGRVWFWVRVRVRVGVLLLCHFFCRSPYELQRCCGRPGRLFGGCCLGSSYRTKSPGYRRIAEAKRGGLGFKAQHSVIGLAMEFGVWSFGVLEFWSSGVGSCLGAAGGRGWRSGSGSFP